MGNADYSAPVTTDTRPDAETDRVQGAGHDTSGPNIDDAMTRSEGRLHVGTENVETGRAKLRKYVVTEDVTQTVPVSHEEVRIEGEPFTDANRGDALDGPGISDEADVTRTRETLKNDVARLDERVSPSRFVGSRTDRIKRSASSAKDKLMGSSDSAAGAASDTLQSAAGSIADATGSAASRVSDATGNAPQALRDQTQGTRSRPASSPSGSAGCCRRSFQPVRPIRTPPRRSSRATSPSR